MDQRQFIGRRLTNVFQSFLLLIAMLGLMVLVGYILAGPSGIRWTLFFGAILFFLAPRLSAKLTLRSYRARELGHGEAPGLYTIVDDLARKAHLSPSPRVAYIPTDIANAFSVGSKGNAYIALSDGLLRSLNHRELRAVLAHELSHIVHNDMGVMAMADIISRVTSMVSLVGQFLLLLNLPLLVMGGATIPWLLILILILSPTVAGLLQLALSRTREFDADNEAAALTGDPKALASALEKMEIKQKSLFQHVFLPMRKDPTPSILRTHPITEERIRRLLSLEKPRE
ncbi:zinc metalloprotease HtpX [Desulfovibrio inopinatus]|uniref:zinc metalloprotease HtpX n=1 Tax=Desulfovibrio inopinatus TaxID=102109 RepID=UPI0003FE98D5|nr:zinc metalloprotease HtpX [Desulfovibrio inopinatus]